MYNLKKSLLTILATTTFLTSCKKNSELHLVQFTDIYPATPAHGDFGNLYFLDGNKNVIDSAKGVTLSKEVSDMFRVRGANHAAPNRFAIAEIEGEKGEEEYRDGRKVIRAKPINPEMTDFWRKKVEEAKNNPEKIFGR